MVIVYYSVSTFIICVVITISLYYQFVVSKIAERVDGSSYTHPASMLLPVNGYSKAR
jgi:hypothetical protein